MAVGPPPPPNNRIVLSLDQRMANVSDKLIRMARENKALGEEVEDLRQAYAAREDD